MSWFKGSSFEPEAPRPIGPRTSAERGEAIRGRLISIIEKVELDIGQLAIAVTEKEGMLMTHPKLQKEIRRYHDHAVLEAAIGICFQTPNAAQTLHRTWPLNVRSFHGKPNTPDIIMKKSNALATFLTYNLDVTAEVCEQNNIGIGGRTEEVETRSRLEEAACWDRIIDELAFWSLGERRPSFMNYFRDILSELLALQGAPTHLICEVFGTRSAQYATCREWWSEEGKGAAGTLLWEAGKNIGKVIDADKNPLFLMFFGLRFLERLKQAEVQQLLTGAA
jgi:hypothetical protein